MFDEPDADRLGVRTRRHAWLRRASMAVAIIATVAVPSAAAARNADRADVDAVRADVDAVDVGDRLIPMRLECAALDGEPASIGCRWSVIERAAGIKLVRVALTTGGGRTTVARFDDPSVNHFVDTPVRRGVRYLYVVRAFDSTGALIGTSRPSVAAVAAPADVEALRLDCTATSATTVRCASSLPTVPARRMTLWRSVDGGPREVVTASSPPFAASYGDVVPVGTSRVAYAVIATDGAGEIVARSRAEFVRMPRRPVDRAEAVPADPEPDTRPVPDTPVVPTEVDDSTAGASPAGASAAPADERPPTDTPASRDESNREVPAGDEPSRDVPTRDEPSRVVPTRDTTPTRDAPAFERDARDAGTRDVRDAGAGDVADAGAGEAGTAGGGRDEERSR